MFGEFPNSATKHVKNMNKASTTPKTREEIFTAKARNYSNSSATTPDNTFATKATAVSNKTTIRLIMGETPPNSIPAYNIGITITRGWAINLT